MMQSLAAPSSALGIVRNLTGPAGPSDTELLASLQRTLLIAALETPPRFRSDIDVVMIQQHLASLGVFASVAPQILHYLATECTITRIPDGDVLFYQEDVVDDHAHASKARFVVTSTKLLATVTAEVTYGKGAICGIDDFYSCSLSTSNCESRHHLKPLCRRSSVHSQESTTIIMLAKDSLDRVNERFGLVYERGALTSTKETLLFHSKRTYEEPTFFSFTTSSPAFRRRRST
ncbi:uncharacterized protein IUM83_07240 [Phytophthora cinnamomi]|uniref:uncharacterized protein n=1 Tax=Phytophthora cinnamomi TaxID=4785 RepID=UPI00355A0F42|nr:hypothetical protein IUM83_07240 [Phytophthora cinnamomi]